MTSLQQNKQYAGTDFTQGSIPLHLMRFLLPFLLANLLSSLYNAVDMIVIGQWAGSAGTVAVSQGGRMLNLLISVSSGLANGGQILIAQLIGARKREDVSSTIGTLFSLLAIISVLLAAACISSSNLILSWLNTPQEAFSSARAYLVITSMGLPLVFGYNAVSSVLRGMGDSRHPLLFIAIAAVCNLILDILFITRLQMGAAGTALATVIGQGIAFLFAVCLLYRQRERFGFDFRPASFQLNKQKALAILNLGLPLTLKGAFINITQTIMLSYVNTFGLVQAAAYGIGDKIMQFCNIACLSISQGGSSLVAQNVGARRYDRARQVFTTSLAVTMIISLLISAAALCFPQTFFRLFSADPEVWDLSKTYMTILVSAFLLSALTSSLNTVTVGTGATRLSMISGLLDGVVFRISFSFFFGLTLGMEAAGFFLGNSLARLGPIMVEGVFFLSGAWKRCKPLIKLAAKE